MLPNCNISDKLLVLALAAALPFAPMQAVSQTNSNVRVASAEALRLDPAAAEIRKALIAGGKSYGSLREFYASRKYAPIWTGRSKAASKALLTALNNSGDHGLPVGRYAPRSLSKQLGSARKPASKAAAEIAASAAYLKYAHDLSSGLIDPRRTDREISRARPRRSDAALLALLVKARRPETAFLSLQPSNANYRNLLAEKIRMEKIAAGKGWGPTVPGGKALKPGAKSNRIPLIRARLMRLGVASRLGRSTEYDNKLLAAVKKFQILYGLNADGVIGKGTLAAMNVSPGQRLTQVLVNLERERWMNFDRGQRYVWVNLADYRVQVFDNGRSTYTSRVVTGSAIKARTQEFSENMTYMVFNPTWNVPNGIAGRDILPAVQSDLNYLSRRNMAVLTRDGKPLDPSTVNFNQYTKADFPYIFKQAPGGGNALGRVKFMFPNKYAIYLHDTPTKYLFARDMRAYSNGCVRVQKSMDFAYLLLKPQISNPQASVKSWLAAKSEKFVTLKTPVPVHLSYNTAWVDEQGTPQYRADIYGRDKKVLRALLKAGVSI